MFSFAMLLFLMASTRIVAHYQGGDGSGRDPDRPPRVLAQCNETGIFYFISFAIICMVSYNI